MILMKIHVPVNEVQWKKKFQDFFIDPSSSFTQTGVHKQNISYGDL